MEKKAISSDLIRGHIDTIILHTLLDGDKFAQQISDSIEEKSQNEYKINQATLYSSLKRLESLKYVNSYWYDSPTGRRKYFKLTEVGKNTVEENLSSWSYSRAIIDKLIDCSPQPIYQTKIVEKIIEVPVEKTVYVQTTSQQKTNDAPTIISNDKKIEVKENKPALVDGKQETSSIDVNFRNIINGLIKSTVVQKSAPLEIRPINKENHQENVDEKLKFNETISKTGYTAGKASNTGKVDFGDLILKASKEGYKLRISSKDSGVAPGKFLINKINLYASLAIYLIVMLEFLFFTSYYKSVNFTTGLIVSLIIVFTAFPVLRLLQFVKSPTKKTAKNVAADKILTVSIIVFNLLIITFAANLIAGISFNDLSAFIPAFIMPCVLYVDFIAYYILKYFIARFSAFVVKPKKTAI